jgi:succinate dehydrogenase / fumarate reductase membrane anchor subunit
MSVNYGSKRVVVGAHYGLRDWLAQRITGVLMVLFTLAVLGQVLLTAVRSAMTNGLVFSAPNS